MLYAMHNQVWLLYAAVVVEVWNGAYVVHAWNCDILILYTIVYV